MRCGEIWWVDFGESTGHEYKKERPALIIQSNSQLRFTTVITILPLTSKKKKYEDDIIITKSESNNLSFDSVLKVHYVQSFDRSRFIKKMGEVNEEIIEQVKNYLKTHFEI